ncbi:response regulator transcription factor [Anaerocolumna xylanovorans]|uniref:Stage 0 sporulation protein A homolog n=1 Tax=Anaerocolumna xylanovorans DSM 12503 TaxID=1121345 RepID=A0A1M7YMW8_9FIRM|nr:response regulator transcription factor [Anaerocolumna xylanovorans]SHO53912.1 two-component system, OmpR family, response regulator VanR [Anaerocolumna xylanovorans DSM 12503]
MVRILFLEDEPTIKEVLTEYMQLKQYDVTPTENGEEAIKILEKQDFDLAVLDIMVPGKSGLEVLSHIRSQKPDMAAIMLTAIDDEPTQVKAFNLFADDYVVKPVSPIILLKRIETILRRTKGSDKKPAKTDGLYLNEEAYQAFYDNVSLQLTLSEFLLLQTLKKEAHRVFTREQLILKIFNEDYIGNDRIIDAHVKNLRKKLPCSYIRTVIGVGYQFNEENT